VTPGELVERVPPKLLARQVQKRKSRGVPRLFDA
jgi:hypothetical protein